LAEGLPISLSGAFVLTACAYFCTPRDNFTRWVNRYHRQPQKSFF